MTVVFAGGGTGGHLYPAIAIADALRNLPAQISFIGTADRLEATIVPSAGYELRVIASRALPRSFSFGLVRTIISNVRGTIQSLRLLAQQRPDIVIATGGYVSFPVALAARIRRMLGRSSAALVLLEPNAEAGLTNRLLMPMVDEVWGPPLEPDFPARTKYVATGVPIRAALRSLPQRADAIARLGLNPSLQTLVAMGGSQGARSINDAVIDLVKRDRVPEGWQIIALTGRSDYERVRAILPATRAYLEEMGDAYAVADLVLARAGASTLSELGALAKPSILVPYPYATQAHQAVNAARFASAGAAIVLGDDELQAGHLPTLLAQTVEAHRLQALAAGAARLAGADPLNAILARIDALTSRKNQAYQK